LSTVARETAINLVVIDGVPRFGNESLAMVLENLVYNSQYL
jgi:hypothetical protein